MSDISSICIFFETGGTDDTEWEDITGSTPMNIDNNYCVSFTTSVSARLLFDFCSGHL